MSIPPTGNTTPVSDASFDPSDFETLVFSTQMSRVDSLDHELDARMGAIKARNDQARRVQDFLDVLRSDHANGHGDDNLLDVDQGFPDVTALAQRLGFSTADMAAIRTAHSGPQPGGQPGLQGHGDGVSLREVAYALGLQDTIPSLGGDTNLGKASNEIGNWISAVQDHLTSLTSNNETEMLGINRLMNARNEAFNVMSNVVRDKHETAKSIIANLVG